MLWRAPEDVLDPLIDKIKITKFKVKYNLVDDLDYFSYPEKFLNDKVDI